MRSIKRHIFIIGIILIVATAAFFGIRSYVFSQIGLRINAKINSLNVSGLNVRYESLSFDWGANLIEVQNLSLEKNAYDTACIYPEFISVGKIRAEGLSLISLIFRNTLSFDDFYLEELRIVMRKNSRLRPESSSEKENDFTLRIDRSFIRSAHFTYTDSVDCRKITEIESDLTLDGLTMQFFEDEPVSYALNWLLMDSTEVRLPRELYTLKIRQARMDFSRDRFRADSIRVIPHVGKIEFGRRHGFEIDRYDAIIPFMEMHNFHFSFEDSAAVTASMAEIQFYFKVFRDKRLPFVKKAKLLPLERLQALPFHLSIDSVKVRKSYVQYEEYAEGANEPGKVFFDNLYASFYNVDNRASTGAMKLRARANLLGEGIADVSVTFPFQTEKRSTLTGAVTDFKIPEINPMLTPSTNIKVESGRMEAMTFSFSFNATRSDGELELKYEDLKLAIFKEEENEKDDDPEKDNLKTFIMNTFIFRKNMDENVPEDKRTGTIYYARDNNRSVFNFWVKSVVSGIKSAYKLDAAEAKVDEREARKEQRLSRRAARKAKRAEKKKDRG